MIGRHIDRVVDASIVGIGMLANWLIERLAPRDEQDARRYLAMTSAADALAEREAQCDVYEPDPVWAAEHMQPDEIDEPVGEYPDLPAQSQVAKFGDAGRNAGKAFEKGLEAADSRASDRFAKSYDKVADASGRLRVELQKLEDLKSRGAGDTKILAQSEAVARARGQTASVAAVANLLSEEMNYLYLSGNWDFTAWASHIAPEIVRAIDRARGR